MAIENRAPAAIERNSSTNTRPVNDRLRGVLKNTMATGSEGDQWRLLIRRFGLACGLNGLR